MTIGGFVGPISQDDGQSYGMIWDEVTECTYSGGGKLANARFIAAARELVPALSAELEAMRAERDDLEGAQIVNCAAIKLQKGKRDKAEAERDGLLRVVTDNHYALQRAEKSEAERDAALARVRELEAALELALPKLTGANNFFDCEEAISAAVDMTEGGTL